MVTGEDMSDTTVVFEKVRHFQLVQLMEGFCNYKHKLFLYILFLSFSHMCASVSPILIISKNFDLTLLTLLY